MEIMMWNRSKNKDGVSPAVATMHAEYIAARSKVVMQFRSKQKDFQTRIVADREKLGPDLATHKIRQCSTDFKYLIDMVGLQFNVSDRPYCSYPFDDPCFHDSMLDPYFYTKISDDEWAKEYANAHETLKIVQDKIDKWQYKAEYSVVGALPTRYDTFKLAEAALKIIVEGPCDYYTGPPLKKVTV